MRSGIFLLLGTNLGDKAGNLANARAALSTDVGKIAAASAIYETGAWGRVDQPSFYNQVVVINTQLDPEKLLEKILTIERELGRVRDAKWGPRIIDIDILFYDDEVVNTPSLTIPHIGIPDRRFVLEPLNEIAPDLFHPRLHQTVGELLQNCSDPLPVKKL